MKLSIIKSVVAALPLLVTAAACLVCAGDDAFAQGSNNAKKAPEPKLENMDPKAFTRPTVIDNKWLPMTPGMRYTYEGTTVEDDGKVVPHKVVIHITDLTKVIGGVRNLVSYDLDYQDGELVEAELAFFAQASDGTVWRFGEYPEEYEDGKVVKSPTWIHGLEGARAGIQMKSSPKAGTPSYSQGWGPAVKWTDRGQVFKMGEKTKVRAGSYTDVLIIKETSVEETKDAWQLKYYAPGVGNVRVGWGGTKEKTKETLELVKLEKLNAREMDEVRKKAMALEKSAYQRSKNVYGRTPPMERAK